MLTRMLAGVAVAVGLVFGAATLAQPPSEPTPVVEDALPPPAPAQYVPPEAKDAPAAPAPVDITVPLPTPAATASEPLPPTTPATPAAETDPEKAVEAFMDRNRKEASEAIKALTKEKEELRSRLQKVESALARWQGVATALEGKRDQALRERVSKRPTTIETNRPTIIESVPVEVPPDFVPAGAPRLD